MLSRVVRPSLLSVIPALGLMLVAVSAPANAQAIVNPTTAVFDPSSDHNATSGGSPVVDHYELEFYLPGASQAFQTVGLGKPTPDVSTGKISVNFASLLVPIPAAGVVYNARVASVGPGGRSSSAVSIDTFSFSAPCTYVVSQTTIALTSAGGTGAVTVTAPSGCAWTATETASWLSITSGSSGSGNGTVNYSATANAASTSQNTTLTVAGRAITVTEAGVACTFTVSPTTISLASGGGTGAVSVTAPSGCAWTATETASWLSITSGSSGSGNGSVNYSATANAASMSQSTTLTVAGQVIAVTEAAPPPPAAPNGLRITPGS